MGTDSGNVAASVIFLFCFIVFLYPIMQYYGGIPPASIFTGALGMSYGEVVICALIIGIVLVWSISQVGVTILEGIIAVLTMIATNEKVRTVSSAISARILHKMRMEVSWIRTEIKKREPL